MNTAERVVLEMGFVWNPIHIESGIDAVIEVRDPSTGVTKNKIIQAQVKAVSQFAAEQDDAFSFSCERAHIGYWLGGTARVILIVCKPDTDEIYWKDLQTYFSLPENRERCTVRFSKKTDRFDVSSRSALLTVAKPEGGLALGPLPKREILGINLLPLSGYPSEILATPTKAKGWDAFFAALKELKKPWLREFIWEAGILYSFFDPEAEEAGDLCEGKSEGFPTERWADSADPVLQRHFAQLLGRTFESRCFKQGVVAERETGVFYFAAPPEGGELQIKTKSSVNTTTKTVVSKHTSLRQDGTPSIYYKQMNTSIAQVFNERGHGIAIKGRDAKVSESDFQPHIAPDDVNDLISRCIKAFRDEHKTNPARVVVHKTSNFDDGEMAAFRAAIEAEKIALYDLVTLDKSRIRLYREGYYPPLRGTWVTLEPEAHVLYTRGSVAFYEEYPGTYVPQSLLVKLFHTEAPHTETMKDLMMLSKLNWNNIQMDSTLPITISAARTVGSILRWVETPSPLQREYHYFM